MPDRPAQMKSEQHGYACEPEIDGRGFRSGRGRDVGQACRVRIEIAGVRVSPTRGGYDSKGNHRSRGRAGEGLRTAELELGNWHTIQKTAFRSEEQSEQATICRGREPDFRRNRVHDDVIQPVNKILERDIES